MSCYTTHTAVTCPVIGTGNCQFSNSDALKSAVDAYLTSGALTYDDNGTPQDLAALGPIGTWCTSGIISMRKLFFFKVTFNEPIGGWDTSSVTDMLGVFASATSFNQDISGWNVGSVTTMASMFESAFAFNQDISGWNVTSVGFMSFMFIYASDFNQNLCPWKDAPAVQILNRDFKMFFNCPGGPQANFGSFDATQCPVSYFEK